MTDQLGIVDGRELLIASILFPYLPLLQFKPMRGMISPEIPPRPILIAVDCSCVIIELLWR